jgi:hypothetical protein
VVRLPQSRAIYRHIARTHGLDGANEKDVAIIDYYAEASRDWNSPASAYPVAADKAEAAKKLADARDKFAPGYERVLVRAELRAAGRPAHMARAAAVH